MKKQISPKQLGDFIDSFMARSLKLRRTIDRHFQGTITDIEAGPNAGTFLVEIERSEGLDDHQYMCAIPGYFPQIGDVVECEWRDTLFGYIKYPLIAKFNPMSGIIAQWITTSANVGVNPSFPGIPQNFTDLELTFAARDTSGGASWAYLFLQFNQDTGANYYDEFQPTTGTTTSVPVEALGQTSGRCGNVIQGGVAASTTSKGVVEIPHYSDTQFAGHKVYIWRSASQWGSLTGQSIFHQGKGDWNGAGVGQPISRIDLLVAPAIGSVFTLRAK